MIAEQSHAVEREPLSQDWGIEPIPQAARRLRLWDYSILWADLGVGMLVLVAGSFLVPGLGLAEALVAIVVGTLVGNVLLAMAGIVGSDTGVPTMVSLRPSLGLRGSYLPSALNIVQLIGWAAFEVLIMAQAANAISLSLVGVSNYLVWVAFFAVLSTFMAVLGPVTVVKKWLEKVGVWAVLLTTLYLTWYIVSHYDMRALFTQPGTGELSFWAGVDLVVAMPVSWLPLVSDYSRFARRSSDAFWGTYVGYFIANVWFYALGAVMMMALKLSDPLDLIPAIATLAGGTIALLVILVDETDNAFANIYSTAVSAQNILPRLSLRTVAIGIGAVVAVLAASLPLADYQWFLLLIGSVFVPLFGILAADYFVVRRRRYVTADMFRPGGAYWYRGGFNIAGILAWLLGVGVYQWITRAQPDLGATIPSFVVSMAAYIALAALLRVARPSTGAEQQA
ncbi:MAG: putative hydroxymethylpyrimidine transporter CytX [Anaerolineae bacterium]